MKAKNEFDNSTQQQNIGGGDLGGAGDGHFLQQRNNDDQAQMQQDLVEEEEINPSDLLSEDLESLLHDLNEFCRSPNSKADDLPVSIENYLIYVSRTGNTVFPWHHIRPLFRMKMLSSISQFPALHSSEEEDNDGSSSSSNLICENETFVLERFDLFRAAPFTIQRLAELITNPNKHYKRKDKYLNGLEKTVLVISTIEPRDIHNLSYINNNDDDYEDLSSTNSITNNIYNDSNDRTTSPTIFENNGDHHQPNSFNNIHDSNKEDIAMACSHESLNNIIPIDGVADKKEENASLIESNKEFTSNEEYPYNNLNNIEPRIEVDSSSENIMQMEIERATESTESEPIINTSASVTEEEQIEESSPIKKHEEATESSSDTLTLKDNNNVPRNVMIQNIEREEKSDSNSSSSEKRMQMELDRTTESTESDHINTSESVTEEEQIEKSSPIKKLEIEEATEPSSDTLTLKDINVPSNNVMVENIEKEEKSDSNIIEKSSKEFTSNEEYKNLSSIELRIEVDDSSSESIMQMEIEKATESTESDHINTSASVTEEEQIEESSPIKKLEIEEATEPSSDTLTLKDNNVPSNNVMVENIEKEEKSNVNIEQNE